MIKVKDFDLIVRIDKPLLITTISFYKLESNYKALLTSAISE